MSVTASTSSTGRVNAGLYNFVRGIIGRRWVIPAFIVFWSALVIVPLVLLVSYSFFETRHFRTIWDPSFNTWISLFDSGRWSVAVRTLRIALTVTIFELLVGFPFALWLAKGCRSPRVKALVLALLTIPFFLDLSSRIIIWRPILGETGLVNTLLIQLGFVSEPVGWLLYSEFSVYFGMVAPYFPTMVLPIFLVISFINDDLLNASKDLGASPLETLLHVIIPLSLPGVIAGIVFTLGPALAAWVEPGMLGGGFVNLLSHSVESAYTALKYPIVAALSTFVIFLLSLLLVLLVVLLRRTPLRDVFQVMKQ